MDLHETVAIDQEGNQLNVSSKLRMIRTMAMTGTMRSLVNNMVVGVTSGF